MRTNTQTRHILKEEKGSILVGAVVLTIVLVVTGFAFLLYVSHATSSMNQSIGIGQEVLQARSAWQSAQYGFHTGTLLPGDGITYDYVKEYIDLKDNKSKYKDTDGESLAWVKVEVRFVEEDDEFFGFATSVRFYYDILSFSGFNWGSLPPYVRMRIADQRTTMADYLYLSDSELNPYFQTPIYFWQEDTLDGKVHSNGQIYTLNDPVFFKTISSCSTYIYPMYGNQGVYLGSPPQRLSVSNIEFPYTAVELREAAWEAGAVLFNPETNTCPPGYFIRGIPDGYTTQVLISGTQVGYKFLPYIEDSLNLDW
ncbi:MAG: hypothetical protein GY855_05565, partial [candidate division Zixibacteria bacterium]|nr:hypothetical protein [candidate division Zixibacteria bacterium]